MSEQPEKHLGLKSGIGLVVANMVGAGVFISAGFMAQDLGPTQILLAWGAGAVLALCGVVAYAEVARLMPKSGGEYRYLSKLWHPFLGYLAGWTSLLIGFSAPIAVDAYAAGAFAHKLMPRLEPNLFGVTLIVLLTVAHAIGLRTSARVQNSLFVVKVTCWWRSSGSAWCSGAGLSQLGASPPLGRLSGGRVRRQPVLHRLCVQRVERGGLCAEEFSDARRPCRARMLIGCAAVAGLYFVLNYVFIANLTPSDDLADCT